MASFNGEKYIADQIKSILRQTLVSVDLVIHDDNSTDKTVGILQEIVESEKNVTLITHDISSGSAGQNFFRAILTCSLGDYDFVAFADQDDIWAESKLAIAVTKISHTHSDGYSCSTEAFWPNGSRRLLHQCPERLLVDFLFEGGGQGCTFVLTYKLFLKARKFMGDHPDSYSNFYYHDWYLYLLMSVWKRGWVFDSEPLLQYRQHSINDTGARWGFSALISRFQLIKSGWYKSQVLQASYIAIQAGSDDEKVHAVQKYVGQKNCLSDRIRFSGIALRYGRRKLSDRLVLLFSIFIGWL